MFGLGAMELWIILVLVLIVFGAGKLPQVGGSLGKAISEFKDGVKKAKEELEEDKDNSSKTENNVETSANEEKTEE